MLGAQIFGDWKYIHCDITESTGAPLFEFCRDFNFLKVRFGVFVQWVINNVIQFCSALSQGGSHFEKAENKKREVKKEKCEPQLPPSSQLDPRAILSMDPRADLLPQLLDFDEAQRQRVFDCKVFCCGICFVEKLGSNCLCFKECQHVYCKACMTEYFQIQIRDGNVQCLNCPEPKCTSLATPSQVRKQHSMFVFVYSCSIHN